MKITAIRQQLKRADRYSIYVDEKYSFSLSVNELLAQKLMVGQEFDKAEFDAVQQTAENDKAYMRALDLLARRLRSIWEMEQYLKRKGYNNNTISIILNKLRNLGLLNDEKFAKSWVSDRRLFKNTSKVRLKQELQQKHIKDQIISAVLDQDETSEVDVLRAVIIKKHAQTRYQDSQKLITYLIRQGFNYHDIKQVLSEL